jgi:nucleoside-diphosphate-sugar epimerase
MSRVLITGAGGFIGRVAVRAFLAAGWEVRAAARRIPPDAEQDAEWRVIQDIRDKAAWRGLADDVQCVVHLAGRAHVLRETEADPLAAFRSVNVEATRRLASEAATAGVRRFVFLSSIGVNGVRTDNVPFRETDMPQPSTPYAISKYEAEQVLRALSEASGLEYVILRAPLVYGSNAPGNFGRLVRWIRRGWPLPFGAVKNRRSLLFVGNLADALKCCAIDPAARNELFLVADKEAVSTPDLVRLLARAFGCQPHLCPVPQVLLRAAERLTGGQLKLSPLLDTLVMDISHIQKRLRWTPPNSLAEGLGAKYPATG